MVKIKNTLTVPVKVVKVNEYSAGTIAPGAEVDVAIDAETVRLVLQP